MRLSHILMALVFLLGTAAPALAQDASSTPPGMPAALATAPSAATSNSPTPEYYKNGLRMGTSYCSGASFDCDTLSSNQSAIIDAANECASNRFGIQEKIMTSFSSSGEFENCVLPGGGSRPVWAVCCIKKADNGSCDLVCTRYLEQKSN